VRGSSGHLDACVTGSCAWLLRGAFFYAGTFFNRPSSPRRPFRSEDHAVYLPLNLEAAHGTMDIDLSRLLCPRMANPSETVDLLSRRRLPELGQVFFAYPSFFFSFLFFLFLFPFFFFSFPPYLPTFLSGTPGAPVVSRFLSCDHPTGSPDPAAMQI